MILLVGYAKWMPIPQGCGDSFYSVSVLIGGSDFSRGNNASRRADDLVLGGSWFASLGTRHSDCARVLLLDSVEHGRYARAVADSFDMDNRRF